MNIGSVLHILSVIVLPLLFAITLHEVAHGWVASKLGDKTAVMLGLVRMNPMKHIDPFGTVLLPIIVFVLSHCTFIFGWAKPVPVTWQNLHKPRRDMILVALAGPFANFLMALLWACVAKISLLLAMVSTGQSAQSVLLFFKLSGIFGITINCIFMLLNLIPLPPLDGSRFISALLPSSVARQYDRIEPYGIWILLALAMFGILSKILLSPVIYSVFLIHAAFGL